MNGLYEKARHQNTASDLLLLAIKYSSVSYDSIAACVIVYICAQQRRAESHCGIPFVVLVIKY
jgi:hypothetical protein